MRPIPTALLLGLILLPARAQAPTDAIRLNQIGFYPNAPKEAVVTGPPAEDTFHVLRVATGDTVYTGTLGPSRHWTLSGESMRRADFSSLRTPGAYVLDVPGLGRSHAFVINEAVHRPVAVAALKGYYFQRASTALDAAHAGIWARPAGHPDDRVMVHPSAASPARPAGTILAAPRGWYDAGDYNKYVVNSGISTYTLLALYEHYPALATALKTNIPESGNDVPDVLDEALWNIRWMLAMQDPHDGGVYHKLTTPGFEGAVMPHQATQPRYVVQKGTAATLDFAAVMAQAARLYDDFPSTFPGLADSLRTAALAAWHWARTRPDIPYVQGAMNQAFDPDIHTGEYGDSNLSDEWAWAAAELAVTLEADSFLTVASPLDAAPDVPWWGGVRMLGWYTLLHHRQALAAALDTNSLKQRFLDFAGTLASARTPYGTVMGHEAGHFVWGSNSVAANQGMLLMQAFRLTADSTYLWAALSNLDYLLGRNATGYSFVTGYGDRTPMHPHHRPSQADGIAAPVPGLLAGGPNPGRQDGCTYPSTLAARAYVDDWCSYASNEIAINWNAPLVYLAAAIEATLAGIAAPTSHEPDDLGAVLPPRLLPPYPNPAREEARLPFVLPVPEEVRLEAFDLLGRRVAAWPARTYPPGRHHVTWSLAGLPGGLYLIRLTSGARAYTHRLLKVQP
ncbi:glycoside hydrolase family 9 protein [Rhodocaloribacter litoris]|uniref:glycoside hydrolase family 9 protein n=1 Tax=Rhodocaloribacter litoris TaxID=2558931 RepID=UPI00141E6785|nr:glycoside hydrolase family 9 protein [Rhodocaloribacter litoris]QXD15451.1 glycoside hydrolase family 9 protein [Rhodocaloribacter litoris]